MWLPGTGNPDHSPPVEVSPRHITHSLDFLHDGHLHDGCLTADRSEFLDNCSPIIRQGQTRFKSILCSSPIYIVHACDQIF